MVGLIPVYAASPDDPDAAKCLKKAAMVELGVLAALSVVVVGLLIVIDTPPPDLGSVITWLNVVGAVFSVSVGGALLKYAVYGLVTREHARKGTIVRVDKVVLQARHPAHGVSRIWWERVKPELRFDLQKAYQSSPKDFDAALRRQGLAHPARS